MLKVLASLIILIACFVGNAPAADLRTKLKGRMSCVEFFPGKFYCHEQDISMSCPKPDFPPIPPTPPLPSPRNSYAVLLPPPGAKFTSGTGFCRITEQRGESHLNLTQFNEKRMSVDWGCKASVQNDAFVYGYCDARAERP